MKTKVIVYSRADGSVGVLRPTNELIDKSADEDAAIALVIAKDLPADAVSHEVIPIDAVLTDRAFRNAWENVEAAVAVNMSKARNLQRERIAVAIAGAEAENDVRGRKRGLGLGPPANVVIPPSPPIDAAIGAAQTVADLVATMPAQLAEFAP